MVIEYQIKRFDLVKSYFYNLLHSRRTQLIVFGVAGLEILFSLFLHYRNYGNLVLSDFIVSFLWGLGIILILPAINFLTAKTKKRTLSINQAGIETKIGTKEGKIPWQAVDNIVATKDRIFIIGKNANTFTIPPNAFASEDLRNKFIELAKQYHDNVLELPGNTK
jgi:hypothetical protein